MKAKALMNWSGGKDSALALYRVLQQEQVEVACLLTTLTDPDSRISMHGIRPELLQVQAQRLGMPLLPVHLPETVAMDEYQRRMNKALEPLLQQGISYSIFGDIFLEDLRRYREETLAQMGMTGLFPLWKTPSLDLLGEFWASGFQTIVIMVNGQYLDSSFCGRILDESFVADLPSQVDPCGENGEFHTFVFQAPYFASPVPFTIGGTVERTYRFKNAAGQELTSTYYFADLLPGSTQKSPKTGCTRVS